MRRADSGRWHICDRARPQAEPWHPSPRIHTLVDLLPWKGGRRLTLKAGGAAAQEAGSVAEAEGAGEGGPVASVERWV